MSSLELACKPLFDGYLPVISDDLELQYSKNIHGLLPQSPKQETGTKLVFTDYWNNKIIKSLMSLQIFLKEAGS